MPDEEEKIYLSSSNIIATPAARIHGSGYSSSGKSSKKSKPYININNDVTPASLRRAGSNLAKPVEKKGHKKAAQSVTVGQLNSTKGGVS